MSRIRILTIAAAVVLLAAIAAAVALPGGSAQHVTAYFPRTTGLYVGNDVRVLGVPIGKITKIDPQGTRVRVDMTYDSQYRIPADAGAALVPPSIVSDRYIELAPAYTSGPVLSDHAVIPEARTAVPLELDEIFSNLDQLNQALGPNGANAHGALSNLVNVGAANLNGNGEALHDALQGLSQAVTTLSNSRGNFFSTITNLQKFTATLVQHDQAVRAVNDDLAKTSQILAGDRTELDAALRNLAVALGQVADFVRTNRTALTEDITKLARVTAVLARNQREVTEIVDDAPLGLQNLSLAYDAQYQTLDSRGDSENSSNPGNPTNPICLLYTSVTHQPCPTSPLHSGTSAPRVQLDPSSQIAQLLALMRGDQ